MLENHMDMGLTGAIGEFTPRLRDVGPRDGIQSLFGNRLRLHSVGVIGQVTNTLHKFGKALGFEMAPTENGGGGQVLQVAQFLLEDPLDNLEMLNRDMTDCVSQVLYRGPQAQGFDPVSDEVHEATILAYIERGVKVFRIFDMMKDPENYKTSIGILKKYQAAHPNSGVVIEGAIPYIKESPSRRATTLPEYGDIAVKLAEQGCDEVVIKDYGGKCDHEVEQLVTTVRAKLNAAGFDHIKLNLHSHGDKPDVMLKALKAGADKVDVAIGELCGGPSHTNMRHMLHACIQDKYPGKFSAEEIDAHPYMQKLAETEELIAAQLTDVMLTDTISAHDLSKFLNSLDAKRMDQYPVAAGALSDLALSMMQQKLGNPEKAKADFYEILDETLPLWKKAGQFDTVTPGSNIIIHQAKDFWFKKGNRVNKTMTMADYSSEYLDVVTDRYGVNRGMHKGIGDQNFRDAAMMYRALFIINSNPTSLALLARSYHDLYGTYLNLPKGAGHLSIDLASPKLEAILTTQDPKCRDTLFDRFKAAVENAAINPQIKKQILAELTLGPAPAPTDGLAVGREVAKKSIPGFEQMPQKTQEKFSLLAMMLRKRDRNRNADDKIFTQLVAKLKPTSAQHTLLQAL